MNVIVKIPRKVFGYRQQGFRFTLETWMLLSEYKQLALSDMGLLPDNQFIPATWFCAAKCYEMSLGKIPVFTEKDVSKWIERMATLEAQKIMDCMLQSKIGGESLMNLIEKSVEEQKKNMAG